MARPYWSGQITISLVSFSVKLFVATEAKSQIAFHQINRATGERVRYQKVTASAAENQQAQQDRQDGADEAPAAAPTVRNDEIVKGYEYQKGQYVTIEPAELANLRVPSKHSMEVTQFVDAADIDPEYFEKPYFIVPENDSQTQAFAVVRQALLDTKRIALSKIAFAGREHVVAIAPANDNGMMAYTMRYAAELRDARDYFRDIKKVEIDEDSLDLAKQLIKRKAGKFDPSKFVDGYEVAVKELVQAKIDDAPIPKDEPVAPQRGKVISLMDALRKSIGDDEPDAAPEPKKKPAKGITLVKSDKTAKPKAAAKAAKTPKRKSA
jgi:DNA end-binding protein Ku